MTVEKILSDDDAGCITRPEALFALAKLITPENIDSIMARLPREWIKEFREWALKTPLRGGVMIGGNLSGEEARSAAEKLQVGILAIRNWFDRQEAADGKKKESGVFSERN